MRIPPLGAHVSIAGGVELSLARGEELGCSALQIFVKSPSQWQGRPLSDDETATFRQARRRSSISHLIAHSTYLINLASDNPGNLRRSRQTLADELDRCARLGIDSLVLHPGAHLGQGEEAALSRITESLEAVLDQAPRRVKILLENTAGQGSLVGYRLEHLHQISATAACGGRLGLCLDTCHAFAAGYPIHRKKGIAQLLERVESLLGLGSLGCIHLNDSSAPRGSRRDRHANIGAGEIGLACFQHLLRDRRLQKVPMIVETPRGRDRRGHRRDLETLRGLLEKRA